MSAIRMADFPMHLHFKTLGRPIGLTVLFVIIAVFGFCPPLLDAHAQERKAIAPLDRENPLKELISGYYFAPLSIRALQDDEFDNPGFPWYEEGRRLWQQTEGLEKKACASCHKSAAETMRGVAASYPKFNPASARVINLEQRINLCRQDKMLADPWKYESRELLSMTVFLRAQSRGQPVTVSIDGPARQVFELGKKEYETKIGQYDLACADCHNTHYGQSLRAEVLSQGHSNGFPSYALGLKSVVSLHERFRACNAHVRAAPLDHGAEAYVALELYLAWRGKGLPVETPAVRP